MLLRGWWGRGRGRDRGGLAAGHKRALDSPSGGDEALEFGGAWGMMIGRCGRRPMEFRRVHWLEFLGAHTESGAGHPSNSSASRRLKDPVPPTSSPRPLPARPPPPGPPRNIPSLSRRGTGPPQFSCRSFTDQSRASNGPGSGGQWLPASLMAVSACPRRHRPETSPSPNGPWATRERERERAKKKHRPLDRAFLRLTGRSAGRPACNSIGSRTPNTHFQL